ncbi:hypothetical protein TASIC1_0001036400 [Trichoderma asperellum]|uniref:Uncharacterized protein n=1 Tax=Trichoderma asperellum TaxID=101201 RepID=A0A6V8QJ68_TRIAP|nr:hypothetical protein LI328DRAFT_123429 [Trichoderma asperelloides]GFP52212.1 hypothetical protein TASIC1_0001036400 [Trichoderma asperellum]
MPARTEWLKAHAAPIGATVQGEDYDRDDVDYLIAYLEGNITAEEAALSIAEDLVNEIKPPTELYRFMGLLCEALVEMKNDREKLLELLEAIKRIAPGEINWSALPGLLPMWSDLYRLHTRGPNGWEIIGEPLPDIKKVELHRRYAEIGTVEATLYVRGLGGVTENWGYELLNLACLRRPGLDVVIGEIHAWLTVAGARLLKDLDPDEVRNWPRPVVGGQPGQRLSVEATMAQHWEAWRRSLLQVSEEKDFLTDEAKRLARECHMMMQRPGQAR